MTLSLPRLLFTMSKLRLEKRASNHVWNADLHELLHDPTFPLGGVSFALANSLFTVGNFLFTLRHALFAFVERLNARVLPPSRWWRSTNSLNLLNNLFEDGGGGDNFD